MQLLIRNELGLKMPIHAPNVDFTPKWGAITSRPRMASPSAEARTSLRRIER